MVSVLFLILVIFVLLIFGIWCLAALDRLLGLSTSGRNTTQPQDTLSHRPDQFDDDDRDGYPSVGGGSKYDPYDDY